MFNIRWFASATRTIATVSGSIAMFSCVPKNIPRTTDVRGSSAPQSSSSRGAETSGILHVAVLGDSQSTGGYGQRLADLIRNASVQRLVYFGAASSARIGSWVDGGFTPIPYSAYFGCDSQTDAHSCAPQMQPGRQTQSIATIVRQHPYVDLYVLTFGDNHFYDPSSARRDIPRLVTPILKSGAKCAFVTPTEGVGKFANKLELIRQIKLGLDDVESANGSTCVLVDSYTVGGDVLKTDSDLQLMRNASAQDPMGLHPQGSGARLWGERVFDALLKRGLLDRL
ncbi:hypothetical protein EBR21_00815 [bacterium]|nr:hypothetical protein [bacterium]